MLYKTLLCFVVSLRIKRFSSVVLMCSPWLQNKMDFFTIDPSERTRQADCLLFFLRAKPFAGHLTRTGTGSLPAEFDQNCLLFRAE